MAKKNENEEINKYRVDKVALKRFGEFYGYFSGEVNASSPGEAYGKLLGKAKKDNGFTYGSNMSFDKTKIVKGRKVFPSELWYKRK